MADPEPSEAVPTLHHVPVVDDIGVVLGEGVVVGISADRTPDTGALGIAGEAPITRISGPYTDGVRTSDTRGWTAAGDVKDGMVTLASATGNKPSHGEDLTIETCSILIGRLNREGGFWGNPVELDQGDGDDCEAQDTRGARLPRLRIQVTRPKIEDFLTDLSRTAKAEMSPSTVERAADALWVGIEGKRLAADRKVVLSINVIRSPWLALTPVVDAFRHKHGSEARKVGFREIWVVGPSQAFTERLDVHSK